MRPLVLFALAILVALPLSAHGRQPRPRRIVVVESGCRPFAQSWEVERWEHRDHRRYHRHGRDCDGRVVLPRPLAPPFLGQVGVWVR